MVLNDGANEGFGKQPDLADAVSDWREDSDPLKDFVGDHCEFSAEAFCTTAGMWATYQKMV